MPTLNWIGKEAVLDHHREVPFHLLRCSPELSAGDPDSGNLLVEGDNLLALKALLPYYAGQVKCIYIDPPYNTGNENWVYNDNVNSPEIRDWLGQVVGKEAEDLSRHDKWLCMMYPRLALLHELLDEKGSLWMSIDDNEVHYVRAILDEVFGAQNFIASVVWQKKQSPQSDAIHLSDMHDYVLVYAKRSKKSRDDLDGWQRNLLPRGEAQRQRYTNEDDDPRGPWTSTDYTCNKTAEERPNLYYAIVNPNTGEEIWPSRQRVWAYEESVHIEHVKENRIWWGKDGKGRPRIKKFKNEVADGVVPSTWWDRQGAADNQEARREFRNIFADLGVDFSTPKPTRLIQRILQIATNPEDLVLDSFAGSGTTGHAVLQQNRQDGGQRRFILVEMEPSIAQPVTAVRLKRVIGGYGKTEGLGGGFRYCRLGETLFDAGGQIRHGAVTFADLARHVFFTETGAPLPADADGGTPLIGVHQGAAIYLLYNGIMDDVQPDAGNVLTRALLAALPAHDGPKVIYGNGCLLSREYLQQQGITFRQTPYEIKVN